MFRFRCFKFRSMCLPFTPVWYMGHVLKVIWAGNPNQTLCLTAWMSLMILLDHLTVLKVSGCSRLPSVIFQPCSFASRTRYPDGCRMHKYVVLPSHKRWSGNFTSCVSSAVILHYLYLVASWIPCCPSCKTIKTILISLLNRLLVSRQTYPSLNIMLTDIQLQSNQTLFRHLQHFSHHHSLFIIV